MTTPHDFDRSSRTAQRILESVKLPSLPEAAITLLSLCRDEHVGSDEIVRVVELDPALSARLLKVANSSYFGQQARVSTLTRAAVVLGNEYIKAVALGFYLSAGWEGMGFAGFNLREFWRDSILRACLARELARGSDFRPREQAFLCGMIGDIGTLVLGTHFAQLYLEILQTAREDFTARQEMEREAFGTDHAQVAETLAIRWQFPEALVVAMGKRCTPPPTARTKDPVEALWQIAHFCAAVPFSHDRQTARVQRSCRELAVSAFGLSFEGLSDIFSTTVEHFNSLQTVFSSLSPLPCDPDSMMNEAKLLMQTLDPETAQRTAGL